MLINAKPTKINALKTLEVYFGSTSGRSNVPCRDGMDLITWEERNTINLLINVPT